jgi:hypothetical protein
MSSHQPTRGRPANGWAARLARPLVGIAVGALVAAAYGAFVAALQFAFSGRWGKGPALIFWATVVGAGLGLATGILSAVVGPESLSSGAPTDVSPAENGEGKDVAA